MKKIELELNNFCDLECLFLEIENKDIEGQGNKYGCKNSFLCKSIIEYVEDEEPVKVEILGEGHTTTVETVTPSDTRVKTYPTQATKYYKCPRCGLNLVHENWSWNLKEFKDVYSVVAYGGLKRRPPYCPRCGKKVSYPEDCRLSGEM